MNKEVAIILFTGLLILGIIFSAPYSAENIPNSEFRIPNSALRIPNSTLLNINNTTYYVIGDLIVDSDLIIDNATVQFNVSGNGESALFIRSNVNFTMKNSRIISNVSDNSHQLLGFADDNSNITFINSRLHNFGWNGLDMQKSFIVNRSNLYISNLTIENGFTGLTLKETIVKNITNINIYNTTNGLTIKNTTDFEISNGRIDVTNTAIELDSPATLTLTNLTGIDRINVINGEVIVKNYLTLLTKQKGANVYGTNRPIPNVNVQIYDNGNLTFQGITNSKGELKNILLTSRIHTPQSTIYNTTTINLSWTAPTGRIFKVFNGEPQKLPYLNMSSSFMETVTLVTGFFNVFTNESLSNSANGTYIFEFELPAEYDANITKINMLVPIMGTTDGDGNPEGFEIILTAGKLGEIRIYKNNTHIEIGDLNYSGIGNIITINGTSLNGDTLTVDAYDYDSMSGTNTIIYQSSLSNGIEPGTKIQFIFYPGFLKTQIPLGSQLWGDGIDSYFFGEATMDDNVTISDEQLPLQGAPIIWVSSGFRSITPDWSITTDDNFTGSDNGSYQWLINIPSNSGDMIKTVTGTIPAGYRLNIPFNQTGVTVFEGRTSLLSARITGKTTGQANLIVIENTTLGTVGYLKFITLPDLTQIGRFVIDIDVNIKSLLNTEDDLFIGIPSILTPVTITWLRGTIINPPVNGSYIWSVSVKGIASGAQYIQPSGSRTINITGELPLNLILPDFSVYTGKRVQVTAIVNSSAGYVENATFIMTSSINATFSQVTDLGNGLYIFDYTAPLINQPTMDTITILVSAVGYQSTTKNVTAFIIMNRFDFSITQQKINLNSSESSEINIIVYDKDTYLSGVTFTYTSQINATLQVISEFLPGHYLLIYTAPQIVAPVKDLLKITISKYGYTTRETFLNFSIGLKEMQVTVEIPKIISTKTSWFTLIINSSIGEPVANLSIDAYVSNGQILGIYNVTDIYFTLKYQPPLVSTKKIIYLSFQVSAPGYRTVRRTNEFTVEPDTLQIFIDNRNVIMKTDELRNIYLNVFSTDGSPVTNITANITAQNGTIINFTTLPNNTIRIIYYSQILSEVGYDTITIVLSKPGFWNATSSINIIIIPRELSLSVNITPEKISFNETAYLTVKVFDREKNITISDANIRFYPSAGTVTSLGWRDNKFIAIYNPSQDMKSGTIFINISASKNGYHNFTTITPVIITITYYLKIEVLNYTAELTGGENCSLIFKVVADNTTPPNISFKTETLLQNVEYTKLNNTTYILKCKTFRTTHPINVTIKITAEHPDYITGTTTITIKLNPAEIRPKENLEPYYIIVLVVVVLISTLLLRLDRRR